MAYTFLDLYTRVGDYMGVSDTPTAAELARIKRIANDGIRYFYMSYNWTFRTLTASGTLTTGSNDFSLPASFGSLSGRITFNAPNLGPQVRFMPDYHVRNHIAMFSSSGRPQLASVRGASGTIGLEAYKLRVWPTPDTDYVFTYQYLSVFPDLTVDSQIPLGANQHYETILEACLMIAELRNDETNGIHAAAFKERLAVSIATDKQFAPDTLGGNSDSSDDAALWNPGDRMTSYGGESV